MTQKNRSIFYVQVIQSTNMVLPSFTSSLITDLSFLAMGGWGGLFHFDMPKNNTYANVFLIPFYF
jgi:hypothetical protein